MIRAPLYYATLWDRGRKAECLALVASEHDPETTASAVSLMLCAGEALVFLRRFDSLMSDSAVAK